MQVKVSPEEIRATMEHILKERFGVENVGWDDDGSAVIDTELDKILKEQKKSLPDPWFTSPPQNPARQPTPWPNTLKPYYLTTPNTNYSTNQNILCGTSTQTELMNAESDTISRALKSKRGTIE